jgi:hypothetical protein
MITETGATVRPAANQGKGSTPIRGRLIHMIAAARLDMYVVLEGGS